MKLMRLILVGGIVCLYGMGAAVGASSKAVDISAIQWVTQNPPTNEDLASSVHVIEFWATWCGPCLKQIPHIKSLTKEYEGRNVIFMGLSVDRSIDAVRKFVKKNNINYHVGMDNGLTDNLGVSGIPKAFIISHEGKILWSGNPGNAGFEDALKSAVDAAPEAMPDDVDLMKIREKVVAAHRLRDKDSKTALRMYKEIIYSSIYLTIEVESIYQQLQKQIVANTPTVIFAEAAAG